MKYIIYITTNQINGKIYIGLHKTDNPESFDNYLGCGVFTNSPKSYMNGDTLFQMAVKKYGPDKFKRSTIKIFDTLEEAIALESFLVDENFVKRVDTYNMTLGGGYPPDLSKKVYQFDLLGNCVKEWKNQVEITKFYNSYKDAIYESIKNKRSFKDCFWSNDPIIDITQFRMNITNKFTYQYNSVGELIHVFESIQEASEKLKIDKKQIINALAQKTMIGDCYFLPATINVFDVIEWRKSKNNGRKIIYRYTIGGEYDCDFKSLADAAKASNLKSPSGISAALKDSSKSSGGYRWSLIKSDKITEVQISYDLKPQPIEVFDLDGNFIKEFDTITECMKEFPYCRRVLRGERKSSNKHIFKYKVKDIV
jgi:hypothetical protein